MPDTYIITATATVTDTDSHGNVATATRQVPTFVLLTQVQGIMSEDHAKRIARDIIDPFAAIDRLDITATPA